MNTHMTKWFEQNSWQLETLHKTGSLAVTIIALEREEKKKKEKKELLQHSVFVFGNPSMHEPRRAGLNFVEWTRRGAVLVILWLYVG